MNYKIMVFKYYLFNEDVSSFTVASSITNLTGISTGNLTQADEITMDRVIDNVQRVSTSDNMVL